MSYFTNVWLLCFCATIFSTSARIQPAQHESWNIPNCASHTDYGKNKGVYVKMEATGYSLFVPRAVGVRLKKVKDADYLLYIFSYGPGKQANVLQGWFGPYASNRSIREKWLQQSSAFTERWAKLGDNKALDSSGQTKGGKHWRYLGLWSSALYYEDASQEAATAFDSMLTKMCYEPWKP